MLADAIGKAARVALHKTRQHLARTWHARLAPIVNVCRRPGYTTPELVFQKARPAGFEPATRCLEDIFESSRDVAWRRPIRRLAGQIIRTCRPALLDVGLRWLPDWLPGI
jgi:hypothetical protein